ncbi:hypothetical protein ACJX0J_016256, partial [Zea mays]
VQNPVENKAVMSLLIICFSNAIIFHICQVVKIALYQKPFPKLLFGIVYAKKHEATSQEGIENTRDEVNTWKSKLCNPYLFTLQLPNWKASLLNLAGRTTLKLTSTRTVAQALINGQWIRDINEVVLSPETDQHTIQHLLTACSPSIVKVAPNAVPKDILKKNSLKFYDNFLLF